MMLPFMGYGSVVTAVASQQGGHQFISKTILYEVLPVSLGTVQKLACFDTKYCSSSTACQSMSLSITSIDLS